MENYKITISDYYGTRSVITSANSKYQALEDIKTFGEAIISCTTTSEQSSRIASGATIRISKRLASYLQELDNNDRNKR